jgi:hypothetical protein
MNAVERAANSHVLPSRRPSMRSLRVAVARPGSPLVGVALGLALLFGWTSICRTTAGDERTVSSADVAVFAAATGHATLHHSSSDRFLERRAPAPADLASDIGADAASWRDGRTHGIAITSLRSPRVGVDARGYDATAPPSRLS